MISHRAVAREQDVRLIRSCSPADGDRLINMLLWSGSAAQAVVSRTARALAGRAPQRSVCVVDAGSLPDAASDLHGQRPTRIGSGIRESAPHPKRCAASGRQLWVVPAGSVSGDPYALLLSDSMLAHSKSSGSNSITC